MTRGNLLICLAIFLLLPITQSRAGSFPKASEGKFITVDGAKLWYLSQGAGEPLVLISGGPGVAHYLYPYFASLTNRFRVIYLDSYGCGYSERAASPEFYTFQRHVEEIEGVRKALGYEKINLLGHSYGGTVAQAFAIKHPKSVNKLILASALHSAEMSQAGIDEANLLIKNHYPEVWASLMSMKEKGVSPLSKQFADTMQKVPPSLLYNADFSNNVELNIDATPELAYSIFGKEADFKVGGELEDYDFRPGLAKLPMPVLVLVGRMDRVAPPAYAEQFKDLIPRCRYLMFEKSGHNLFQEETGRMNQVIGEFLP